MNPKRLLILIGTASLSFTLVFIWLLFLSGPPVLTRAASYTVCEAGSPSCDYGSLQEAVDAAIDGDVIKVAKGTYAGINNRFGHAQVVYLDKNVTIRGGYTTTDWATSDPVANPTTVDAEGQGRVLYISGNISPTIEGLRITGGEADGLGGGPYTEDVGGGIVIISATASIRDNYIYENAANSSHNGDGGGVYLYQSGSTLESNTIISNTAQRSGGGIKLYESAATLTSNTISANNVPGFSGDGIFIQYSPATLIGNTITDHLGQGVFVDLSPAVFIQNMITGNLRGIFLWESDNASLYGNTISHNSTGGLWSSGDNVTLKGNTISHNTADWWAGIDVVGQNVRIIGNTIFSNTAVQGGGGGTIGGEVEFIGNTVISNTAQMGGGLLIPDAVGVHINGNTFSGNHASSGGGGLELWNGNPILTNNIIADNHTDGGSALNLRDTSARLLNNTFARNSGGEGIAINVDIYTDTSTITLTNNIIVSHTIGIRVVDGASVSLESTLWGNEIWSNGLDWTGSGAINTTADLWGDPDFVDYLAGDYHIGENSDARDEGVDAGVTHDMDGQPRPYQAPDIGADEYWPPGVLKHNYLPLVNR